MLRLDVLLLDCYDSKLDSIPTFEMDENTIEQIESR